MIRRPIPPCELTEAFQQAGLEPSYPEHEGTSPQGLGTPSCADEQAELEALAAIEFEPWDVPDDVLPTNAEWASMANPHLATLRAATAVLGMTKAELMQLAADPTYDGLGDDMAGKLHRTAELMSSYRVMAEVAHGRLLAAMAAAQLRTA